MSGLGLVAILAFAGLCVFGIFLGIRASMTTSPPYMAGVGPAGRSRDAAVGGGGAAEQSIYEQIGGEAAVNAAVDIFYKKVLADDHISRFFDGVDMEKQAAKQKAFLTMVMGGPNNYTGLDMREGHKHLVKMGLDDSHFDRVVELLGGTLAELGVPDNIIGQIAAVAESTRDDVLNRGGEAEAPAAEQSIYEQIGGEPAVDAAVGIFYKKVLADDHISRFFDGVDMEKQAAKQKAFLTMVMGGPNNYTGKDMREGHKHLIKMGLDDSHFDRVVELLGETLTELGVPAAIIGQIAAVAETTRDDVLNRNPEGEAEETEMSIYEQIGGEAAVNLAVDNFYKKVLADDLISHYFDGIDMEKQAAKQKAFITMVTGGPNNYTGLDMREGHKHLEGLNDAHFDRVVSLLGETLTELNVPAELIGQIAAVAETTRDDVLNR